MARTGGRRTFRKTGVAALAALPCFVAACGDLEMEADFEALADGGTPAEDAPPVRTVQPGAAGQEGRTLSEEEAAALAPLPHNEADVRFMRGMIHHHAQALEMVGMIAERTESASLRLLGQRIAISQRDEIALMRRWLERRGEAAPAVGAGHAHGLGEDGLMPGMLSRQEMDELAAANGADFERLFLSGMIKHHEGALNMVAELYDGGGGQETEIFRFAADVDADQYIEIQRMRGMLALMLDG